MTEASTRQPILDVRDLSVSFETQDGRVEAVKTLSFDVARGECLGLVGESGSGKSQTVLAAMGLTAANGVVEGSIRFDGVEMTGLDRKQLNDIRGARMAMIFQDPLTSLTAHMTVGAQMAEVLARHKKMKGAEAEKRIVEWLERVRIPEARRRLHQFPHELSGGMRQRVMIASAMLCEPQVLLADEPTTALDVTVQAQVLDLMDELKRETGAGLVLITHDMGVIARMADRVVVMRHGDAVERGQVDQVFAAPAHAYTRMLLDAMPRMDRTDRGSRPSIGTAPPKDVAPILEKSCANCHDPKKAKNGKVKAGFDSSNLKSIVKGGKEAGEGIVWGDASKSSLYKTVNLALTSPEDDLAMPPKKSHEKNPPLTKEQVAKIKAFIEAK